MQRTIMESTNLSEVGYDKEKKLLEITFNNGIVYHYFDVADTTHEGLLKAPSAGKYFNVWIRGKYKYTRIGG